MSLEAKIDLLTAAVEALTRVLSNPAPVLGSDAYTNALSNQGQQAIINEREKEIVAAEVKAGNESSTPQSGTQSEPDPETPPLTYDDVKRATNALSAAKGKEITIAALAHFGVTRATQLTEGQWADYVAYANKAAA